MIIFDCNGVLVDSEPVAAAVAAEAFQRAGIDMTPDMVARYFTGRRPADMCAEVEKASGVTLPPKFATLLAAATLFRLRQELRAIPHVSHALSWLRGPKCVASSSSLDRVRVSLVATELNRFFGSNLFSANDVPDGKPAPDLFRHVAQQMGIQPQDCIVVEDSPAGVTAAVAAGMKAIGFVGGSHADEDLAAKLEASGATSVIADMRALKAAVTRLRGY
ncbi:MAG: HAD family hydrolase [Pseudorhodoplanes sp.]|uniref:HAD family hydrolase n=1 Tax=Pseudorhodoplanes sp. TaxID=1934341 RepID=UPI003D0BD6F0